jgi:carbamoyl-phosphate synthase/aspartate carbamoyltransferase/dihydroorotase
LETALPLYLSLVREGLITQDGLVARLVTNPRRVFNLPEQPDTRVEVDVDVEWTAHGAQMQTRAQWTPFEGMTMRGRVERVVLRGKDAYRDGEVLAVPGSGHDVRDNQ